MAGEGGNIIRNIFGKSYKEAESISKAASKGSLDFKSPKEATFHGKKGGKKFNEYGARREHLAVRVMAVKCYKDIECKNQVSIIEKNTKYFYKVIQYNKKPTKAEIKHLKWGIQYDDGKIADAPQVNGEEKISHFVSTEHQISKLRVYAYFKAPNKNASAEVKIKGVQLPMLIGYSKGFDLKHHYMSKLNNDVKKIALSQEDSTYGLNGRINIKDEDCDNLDGLPEATLKTNLINLIHTGTTLDNGLKEVGEEMVNHFYSSLGGEYENKALNNVISKDSNFTSFKNAVAYKILIKLKQVNWDLSKIKENELVRFDNVAFNTDTNHDDGLTILIDAVEHIEVYIEEYKLYPNNKFYLKLKFVLYDTFGLDLEDIKKFGKRNSTSGWRHLTDWNNKTSRIYVQNNYGLGFTSWWVLQHRFNRKPFITKVTLLQEGYYSKNEIYRSPKDEKKNTSNDTDYGQTDK